MKPSLQEFYNKRNNAFVQNRKVVDDYELRFAGKKGMKSMRTTFQSNNENISARIMESKRSIDIQSTPLTPRLELPSLVIKTENSPRINPSTEESDQEISKGTDRRLKFHRFGKADVRLASQTGFYSQKDTFYKDLCESDWYKELRATLEQQGFQVKDPRDLINTIVKNKLLSDRDNQRTKARDISYYNELALKSMRKSTSDEFNAHLLNQNGSRHTSMALININKPNVEVPSPRRELGRKRPSEGHVETRKCWLDIDVDHASLDELITGVKRELPHFMSDAPPSRWDAATLYRIYDSFRQSRNSESEHNQQHNVMALFAQELTRQIALECSERGEVLAKLWNDVFHLYTLQAERLRSEIEAEKRQNWQKLDDLRKKHELGLQERVEEMHTLESQVVDLRGRLDKRAEKERGYVERDKLNLRRLENARRVCETITRSYKKLERQYNYLWFRTKHIIDGMQDLDGENEDDESFRARDNLKKERDDLDIYIASLNLEEDTEIEKKIEKVNDEILMYLKLKNLEFKEVATEITPDLFVTQEGEAQTELNLIDLVLDNQGIAEALMEKLAKLPVEEQGTIPLSLLVNEGTQTREERPIVEVVPEVSHLDMLHGGEEQGVIDRVLRILKVLQSEQKEGNGDTSTLRTDIASLEDILKREELKSGGLAEENESLRRLLEESETINRDLFELLIAMRQNPKNVDAGMLKECSRRMDDIAQQRELVVGRRASQGDQNEEGFSVAVAEEKRKKRWELRLAEAEGEIEEEPSEPWMEDVEERESADENDEDASPMGKSFGQTPRRLKKLGTRRYTLDAKAPILGRVNPTRFNNESKKTQATVSQLIAKLKEKKVFHLKTALPLKSVLKTIFNIFVEKSSAGKRDANIRDMEMALFVYNNIMKQYGFKKLADQKFVMFVLSIRHYLKILKVNIFARMMGLLDDRLNYSNDETKKYLEAFEFVGGAGTDPLENKQYVSFNKALEYLKQFSEQLERREFQDMRNELDAQKKLDARRQFIVDLDDFLTIVLVKFRKIITHGKMFASNAFIAADLDGNGKINFQEFLMLSRHIMKKIFSHEEALALFDRTADLFVDDEMHMSFDKFTLMCVEHSLFLDEHQDEFLGLKSKDDLRTLLLKTQQEWELVMERLEGRLREIQILEQKESDRWGVIIAHINTRIKVAKENDGKPLLIAIKVSELELERIISEQNQILSNDKFALFVS